MARELLGGVVLFIFAALGAGAMMIASSGTAAASDDTRIKSQVTAYFNLYLQLDVIPTGVTPGHVSASTVSALNQQAVQLTKVETGDLLTSQTQALKMYSAALQNGDPTDIYTAGAVDAITFDAPALITGDAAVISGRYSYRFDSYHMENGARVPDGLRGTDSFTAQLQRLNGVWLVASVHTDQLDVKPNYSLPPAQLTPPLPTGPQPTKPPPPSNPVKKLP